MKNYILEVCADSVESALSAKAGGATRLELCANLVIGGTTPGYELFEQVKKETGLPIRVLIRPRFGDFLYSEYEYQQMLCDVCHFAEAGADGVVIGSLNADGTLNETQMRGLARAAGDSGITLHRAFDVRDGPHQTRFRSSVNQRMPALTDPGTKLLHRFFQFRIVSLVCSEINCDVHESVPPFSA